jgi:hypothetical protein
MKRMCDSETIFVQYPVGAGGWFLTSLIYHRFDQQDSFEFDQLGSGHGNRAIQYINNFYKDFLRSDLGEKILEDTGYDTFSREQRIQHIKDSLFISPLANNNVPQVVSLHCKNIEVFLEAFPNSKCVQINIDQDDLITCTFNYLFKILAVTPINFETFCAERGIVGDDFKLAQEKVKDLTRENMKYFQWVTPFIEKTARSKANSPIYDSRIFEIDYKDYMSDTPQAILTAMFDFLDSPTEPQLLDTLVGYMLTYRSLQPKLK